MTDHSELVAEMCSIEKMATPERLKHAKKRRSQQLKRFANYEKQLEKDKSKKNKQSQNQKRQHRKKARVKFIHNIMLLEAAARSDIDEVRRLLMAGVSADVTNEDGLTALHQCCIDDNEDMLKLLLEFGANVNARDSEMWTPLHAAATCGHVHLCKLLIDKGAELLAVNADGNMPYDICEDEVALDYIETEMAKRGITQDEIDEKRLETERKMLKDLKKMAEEGRSLEYRDNNRATPLHVAAANGYIEVVEFLLDHHVSLDVRDEDSWMPIHAAACWLQPEVLEILVKNGADLDAKTLRNGETPFDLAEDPDVKQKILDLKDELETHRASRSSQPRNRRVNTRGHSGYNHSHYSSTGSLYSSNGSLNEKQASSSHGSNHSASLRRTSMRGEKRPLFKKEAKEEALHFGMFSMNNDEDDIADINDENKENLPATNIDDVTLIIEDEPDKYLNERKEKSTKHNSDSLKLSKGAVAPNNAKNRESQKARETVVEAPKPEPQRTRSAENEVRKSDPSRRSHEPEAIHVHMGREGSGSQIKSSSSPNSNHSRDTRPPTERNTRESQSKSERETQDPRPPRETDTRENGENKTAVNPQGKQTQGRTPSFRKNRDSQRKTHEDQSPSDSNTNNYPVSGVRYPSGTPTGTLADLKKHRAENHKFGNSIDTQVQNLFLHSLSGDGKKYSTGSSSSPASPPSQQPSNKETSQNGRNVKNNNNNNSTPTRPPTYISDSGPLRRFSAPTSAPVIGDDDKFKSNCCVVM